MLDFVPGNRPCTGSTRRGFLAGSFGALALAGRARSESSDPAQTRSVILVHLGGGFSHIDTFDPKPDAPSRIRGNYAAISTSVPGLQIGEKLPRMAKRMDRIALVRSFTHDSDHHETATNRVLSGRSGSAFGEYPAMGAVAAHEFASRNGTPVYFAIPRNPSFTWELGKSAGLGKRCESTPTGEPENANEPPAVRERYGLGTLGQSLLLARRLVNSGARFVTVNAGGWDHHANIFDRLDSQLPELDRGLSALIEDLDGGTLLVVMSEFGRTPGINANGGRDHWAAAATVLFAGAGVKPGVIGRTDRYGAFVTDRPVSPADVAQTIYASLGIDAKKMVPTRDGRSTAILDSGEPIREVMS